MSEEKKKPFDLRTHVRNKKTGVIEAVQPYKMHCLGAQIIYERGGKMFYPDGTELITEATKRARIEAEKRKVEEDRLMAERIAAKKAEEIENEKIKQMILAEDAQKEKDAADALIRADEEHKAKIDSERIAAQEKFKNNKNGNGQFKKNNQR